MVQQKHVWGIDGEKAKGTESLKMFFLKKIPLQAVPGISNFFLSFLSRARVWVGGGHWTDTYGVAGSSGN